MKNEKPVAAITGAAQGIGRRVAEVLAERGYRVALNDLRRPRETLRAIQASGGEALAHVGNVADESAVEQFRARHIRRVGPSRRAREQRWHQLHISGGMHVWR